MKGWAPSNCVDFGVSPTKGSGHLAGGMEAAVHARRFERLLAELDFELWIGDPAETLAQRVRKQKNDRQDAEHRLGLLVEDRFPQIWAPCLGNRDLRNCSATASAGADADASPEPAARDLP